MAYTTLAEVKTFCKVTGASDDTLLTALMAAAVLWIENKTQRIFEVSAASDATFSRIAGVPNRFDGKKLYFYQELATSVGVTITDSPTVLYLPESGAPYYGCVLTDGSWAYPTVTINGKWGYSETADEVIELIVWRVCKWLYDMKNTQSGDLVITPEGQVLIPEGVPGDITALLAPYIKVSIR